MVKPKKLVLSPISLLLDSTFRDFSLLTTGADLK